MLFNTLDALKNKLFSYFTTHKEKERIRKISDKFFLKLLSQPNGQIEATRAITFIFNFYQIRLLFAKCFRIGSRKIKYYFFYHFG